MKKLITLLLAGLCLSSPSSAVEIAPQPCDAQYWRQMSARAWMEAEREIMQNQNLIFKPDSVLEYTCFERFIDHNAGKAGDIFVHTDYFGPKIIARGSNESMEVALQNVVASALQVYNNGNHKHTFLGDRSRDMPAPRPNDKMFTGKVDYQQSYECEIMSKVWKAAKCMNFIDNAKFQDSDGFYPFEGIKKYGPNSEDVAGYDTIKETRQYPIDMKCDGSSQGAAGTWTDQITLANNDNNNLYKFQEPLGKIFKEVGDKLEPANCKGEQGIKTGVMVIVDGKESHPDGVCTNPGCVYTKAGTCDKK